MERIWINWKDNCRKALSSVVAFLLVLVMYGCSGNSSDEPESEMLVLNATSLLIEADGADVTEFTVTKGNQDVTAAAEILQDGKVFSGTRFYTDTEGEYKFSACYNGETSAEIVVRATKSENLVMPADPEPDRYEGFVKRVLLLQATGTWCGFCPLVMSGIKTYSDTYSDGLAVFAAAHASSTIKDLMETNASRMVLNWLGISSFPTLNVNMIPGKTVSYVSEGNVGEQNAGLIRQAVEEYTAKDAKSAIAAVVRADKASNKVEVEAKIKIAEGGSYRVAAWLLEDGILDNSQQNYTDLTDDFSTHNNVLRQSSASLAFGDKLGDSLPAGSTEDYSCSFTLSSEKMDNCRVVIMVTAPEGGVFAVDNVVMCPLNDKVGFEYK